MRPSRRPRLQVDGPYKHLTLSDGSVISSHVVMLAMGVSWNLLTAAGASRFTGAGMRLEQHQEKMARSVGCQPVWRTCGDGESRFWR